MKKVQFVMCLVFCLSNVKVMAQTQAMIGCLKYQFEGNNAYVIDYDESTIPENLVIPETIEHNNLTYKVTKICKEAIRSKKIRSLIVNPRLSVIEEGAFWHCLKLEKIDVCADSIGAQAFSQINLKEAIIHGKILGSGCFFFMPYA